MGCEIGKRKGNVRFLTGRSRATWPFPVLPLLPLNGPPFPVGCPALDPDDDLEDDLEDFRGDFRGDFLRGDFLRGED